MAKGQNFKKGDSVRYTGQYSCYVRTDITRDDTYTVREVNGDICLVDVPSEGVICVNDLELVERADRRTAFLTRLQSLLREFDAEIIYRTGRDRLDIDLGIGDNRYIGIEFPFTYHPGDGEGYLYIDADNIMDLDKE